MADNFVPDQQKKVLGPCIIWAAGLVSIGDGVTDLTDTSVMRKYVTAIAGAIDVRIAPVFGNRLTCSHHSDNKLVRRAYAESLRAIADYVDPPDGV